MASHPLRPHMNDSYLLDAGWFFFAAWGMIVLLVGFAAFGRDLFPSEPGIDAPQKTTTVPVRKIANRT
jgi:hypothetical protein